MKNLLILIFGIGSYGLAHAQQDSFFTEPSLLKFWEKDTFDLGYVHPDIIELASHYTAVMVDEPEILIASDSRYKGAKGDHLKQLGDVGRMAMIERIEAGGWTVSEQAGPHVLYIRWAISDLYLKKKRRGYLSYTPLGIVVHASTEAAIKDLWQKIDIVELGVEIEWLDSTTGAVLAAARASRGARRKDGKRDQLVRWEDLDALFQTIGEQTRCHMDNNQLAPDEKRMECDSIVIEATTESESN